MGLIRPTRIELMVKTETGTDRLMRPIYDIEWISVDGCLFGEPSSDETISAFNLYGKEIHAMLAIPKGDEHNWEDTFIRFNGVTYRTIGSPIEGIEENVPLSWHKKVRLIRYVESES